MQAEDPTARPVASCGPEVWRVHVDAAACAFDELCADLDEEEQRLAWRFRNAPDRMRFVVARSSLRRLLASRLGVARRALEFRQNAFGKPFLLTPSAPVHFNTSHSGDWVLHVLDMLGPVGIDVEFVRADLAKTEDFELVLSTQEYAHVAAAPPAERALELARAWVRKEAYVKAIGEGVSRSLPAISIGVDGAGRPCLLHDRNATASAPRWQFEDIEIDAKHVACVVYGSAGPQGSAVRAATVRDLTPAALEQP